MAAYLNLILDISVLPITTLQRVYVPFSIYLQYCLSLGSGHIRGVGHSGIVSECRGVASRHSQDRINGFGGCEFDFHNIPHN